MLKYLPPIDYCRLCVKSCNDNQRSLYDETGQANSNHDLVAKYFTNAMLNMEWERRLQYICEKCWQHIREFHQFQQSIIEAQKGPHLHTEAAKEIGIKPEMEINQQELQLELPSDQALSSSTEGLYKSTALIFDIKNEEPLDLNSDYNGMSPHGIAQLTDEEATLKDTALTNDIESNEDFSSNDELPLSSFRQTKLYSSQSKFATTKRSVEEFDELVALWRSSLECEICHQLVASYSQLKEHFNKNHVSEICYLMCCQLRLDTRYDIENHIHYHNAPQQLRCKACCKAFRLKTYLKNHIRKVHTSKGGDNKNAKISESRVEGKYRCCKCSKDFATKTHLNTHNRDVHKIQIYECNICEKSYTRPDALSEHLAIHKGEKKHACSFCPKAFTCRSYYRQHMKKQHLQEWKKMHNEPAQTEKGYRREIRGESVVYVCRYCSMEYDKLRSMYHHLNRCQKDNETIEPKMGFRQETRGESVIYVCIYCSKEYEKRVSMLNHIRQCQIDNGPMEPKRGYRREARGESMVYVCIHCSKEYERRYAINNHIRQSHEDAMPIESEKGCRRDIRGEVKIFVCIYCSKEYEKYQSMSAHLSRCHRDERSLAKPRKGYRLETRGGGKVYACSFCSKEYEKYESLNAHIYRCHKDESSLAKPRKGYRRETRGENKVYVCMLCSKEYENRNSMIYHLNRFHRDEESLTKQATINSQPSVPAGQISQDSLNTRTIGRQTGDKTNKTPNGDMGILNELCKEGEGENATLTASLEGIELQDENATRTTVKTEQFLDETNALGNEEIDEKDIPHEFEEATWESEEFIKSEVEEFMEL
ncbi:zinc finger protein 26 [Stomoxys calcitrans]|uniref:zinc finger protein 26 n=1 Tax=Stomoxys calcitrans TaxID=35570 RepID=UPI0027E37E88|nr:zinc finger protein 26 [Stomoxys calcitrans]